MTNEQNGTTPHDEDPLASIMDLIEGTKEVAPRDYSEGQFPQDMRAKLIEYWQAEVAHHLAQIRRLTAMNHQDGLRMCKERLRMAQQALAETRGTAEEGV